MATTAGAGAPPPPPLGPFGPQPPPPPSPMPGQKKCDLCAKIKDIIQFLPVRKTGKSAANRCADCRGYVVDIAASTITRKRSAAEMTGGLTPAPPRTPTGRSVSAMGVGLSTGLGQRAIAPSPAA